MYFKLLPEHIKEAIVKLTKDEVFQNRFATDKELDRIEELKVNKNEEYLMLQATTKNTVILNGNTYPTITPIIWTYLWNISSPFVGDDTEKISKLDVDIVMYLIYNRFNYF
jgi:hypothetical protein